jgi:hypothetical protein
VANRVAGPTRKGLIAMIKLDTVRTGIVNGDPKAWVLARRVMANPNTSAYKRAVVQELLDAHPEPGTEIVPAPATVTTVVGGADDPQLKALRREARRRTVEQYEERVLRLSRPVGYSQYMRGRIGRDAFEENLRAVVKEALAG